MKSEIRIMREVFIEQIYKRMRTDKNILFLSADFGAPMLDKLRMTFKNRFFNVGIAEQNLINISTGLALEEFVVYVYALAPFLTMRAYEQLKINVSLLTQLRPLNINLIGVGAGISYDLSGPTHHSLEDISIIRALPNIEFFSPSDSVLVEKFFDYSIEVKKPKYLRLDGKPLANIYSDKKKINWKEGLCELRKGEKVCLVTTGYMTQKAIKLARELSKQNINIGVIDVFMLKPFNQFFFLKTIKKYQTAITLEEAFVNKGGLDSIISCTLHNNNSNIRLKTMGLADKYVFDLGAREYLHKLNKLDEENIIKNIKELLS
ncbi:MAG: transketolase C-terminal domain-containing protein [Elusimicrobiota bacterium]